MDPKLVALRASYQEWVNGGMRESAIPEHFKGIHKLALRRGWVSVVNLRHGDRLINWK